MPTHLLNIGNTHTEHALADSSGLVAYSRVPTADVIRTRHMTELDGDPFPVLAACVVPEALTVITKRYGLGRVAALTAETVFGLDFSLVDPSTVGADRVANALSAYGCCGGPVIVLDCGTAITTEAVDREGRFRGGAIMPGRSLLRQALRDHTAQLPLVEMSQDLPLALGTDTKLAIRAGIDCGVLGAVARIIADTRSELNALDCPVVAVGGDAPYFTANLQGVTAGAPLFTLTGIATQLPPWERGSLHPQQEPKP